MFLLAYLVRVYLNMCMGMYRYDERAADGDDGGNARAREPSSI